VLEFRGCDVSDGKMEPSRDGKRRESYNAHGGKTDIYSYGGISSEEDHMAG